MDTTSREHFLIKRHLQLQKKSLQPPFPPISFEKQLKQNKGQEEEFLPPIYLRPEDIIDEFGRFKVAVVSKGQDLVSKESAESSESSEPKSVENTDIITESVPSADSSQSSPSFVLPKHLETLGSSAFEKIKSYMKRRFPERLNQCKAFSAVSEQVYTAWRSRTRKREAEWGDPEDLGRIQNDPRPESIKIAPECPQLAVKPKFLLPSYFITNLLSVGRNLYYSNRPSLLPTTNPTSRFMANTAVWSPSERKTFIELYLQHPKNFGRIAANLPYKSCEQCVEFYYRHKKEYKLKQMVASYRKAMVAQRKLILNTSGNLNSNPNSNNSNNLNILPPSNATNSNNSVEEDSSSSGKKRTGRPVGRPKNKEK